MTKQKSELLKTYFFNNQNLIDFLKKESKTEEFDEIEKQKYFYDEEMSAEFNDTNEETQMLYNEYLGAQSIFLDEVLYMAFRLGVKKGFELSNELKE